MTEVDIDSLLPKSSPYQKHESLSAPTVYSHDIIKSGSWDAKAHTYRTEDPVTSVITEFRFLKLGSLRGASTDEGGKTPLYIEHFHNRIDEKGKLNRTRIVFDTKANQWRGQRPLERFLDKLHRVMGKIDAVGYLDFPKNSSEPPVALHIFTPNKSLIKLQH